MAEIRSAPEQVAEVAGAVMEEATSLDTYGRSLDRAGWDGPSWCEGWSVHEVVSHLVEGTERFGMQTRAALAGEPVPEFSVEERTARRQQVKALPIDTLLDELVRRNTAFMDYLRGLPAADLTRAVIPLPAGRLTAAQVAQLRLQEMALHHWDCLAPVNPEAALKAEAAALMADYVIGTAARQAKKEALARLNKVYLCELTGPGGGPVSVICRDGAVQVSRFDSGPADVTLSMLTETFLRLVWGRVDLDRALQDGTIRAGGEQDAVRALGRVFGNR